MTGTDTLEIVADMIDELHAESKHVTDDVSDMLAVSVALSAEAAEVDQTLNSIALERYGYMRTSQPERAVT